MLQVQSLSVEIGGRLVVENATFTVMPKDKVGLVGRNGAGKTTLFKVLGGEAEPIAGKIMRKGGFGYLPKIRALPAFTTDALRFLIFCRAATLMMI